ncbi:hypothetical protein [Cytobacillus gottheilii]
MIVFDMLVIHYSANWHLAWLSLVHYLAVPRQARIRIRLIH